MLAAPFIGSFLGVLILRLPTGRPVALARSACAECGEPLGVRDLVPLLSYLALRGRCRFCGAPIGVFHPAVELATVAVAGCAAWAEADPLRLWIACGLGWSLLALAWIDLITLLLPDALTLPLIPAGLLVTWAWQPADVLTHVVAAVLGYALFEFLALAYRRLRGREGLGGGDARLIAAAGAWCGLIDLPAIILLSALFGLAAALLGAIRSGRLDPRVQVPFGPSIAAAFWVVWLFPGLLA
jgi:leader peptidase (prepilin peptidase)/N-methyltransferase